MKHQRATDTRAKEQLRSCVSQFLPLSLPCILACVSFIPFAIFTYLSPHFFPAIIFCFFFHFSSPISPVHFPSILLILCTFSPCFSPAATHLFVYTEVSLPEHVRLPWHCLNSCCSTPSWPVILKLALSNILDLDKHVATRWRIFPNSILFFSVKSKLLHMHP